MKTRNPIRLTLLVIALLSPPAAARGEWRGGIGVLGDSYSDEYQFYPPHRSTARNWVEILATTRGLNFGRFSTASRGEPRNQGYEYNWARSDATTDDLIATGQHLGVAAQAARGEVGLVVVFIGGNDFINAMKTPDPVAAFREVGPRAEANLERAVATILEAHPDVKVVIITVPDIRELPEFRVPLSTGHLPRAHADAATATIRRYNASIRALASHQPRVAVLDFALFARGSELVDPEAIVVAGRRVVRSDPSDDPDHLFLGDVRHLGTVGQGELAAMVVATINARFAAGVRRLSQREILEFADAPGPDRSPMKRVSAERASSGGTAQREDQARFAEQRPTPGRRIDDLAFHPRRSDRGGNPVPGASLRPREDPRRPDPRPLGRPALVGPDDPRALRPTPSSGRVTSSGPSRYPTGEPSSTRPPSCDGRSSRPESDTTPTAPMRPSTGWS